MFWTLRRGLRTGQPERSEAPHSRSASDEGDLLFAWHSQAWSDDDSERVTKEDGNCSQGRLTLLPLPFRFRRSVHSRCPTGFLSDEHCCMGRRAQTGRATVVNGQTKTERQRKAALYQYCNY